MSERSLKDRLRDGEICLGTHSYTASPAVVEMIGRSGFDWVLIDCEHAPICPYDGLVIEGLVRAAELSGVTAFVRIPELDESMVLKVLDCGAAGIVVPHVSDAETARRAVAATRYPPDGTRGTCSNTRSIGYYSHLKREGFSFYKRANERVMTVVLVEDYAAVENINEILDVEGVDAIYIGPRDLSMSMGMDMDSAPVHEAVAHLMKASKAKGVTICRPFHYPDLAAAERLVEEGATMLACTSDVRIFFEACSQITSAVDKVKKKPQIAR